MVSNLHLLRIELMKTSLTPLLTLIALSLSGCSVLNNTNVSEEFISSLPVENYDSMSFDKVVSFYAEHCEGMFVAAPSDLRTGFGLNVLKFTSATGSFSSLDASNPFYSENPHYIRYRNALRLHPDIALEEMQAALDNHKERLQRFSESTDYFVHQVYHQLQVDRQRNTLVLVMDSTLRFEEGVDTLRNELKNDLFRNNYNNHQHARHSYQSRNRKQNNLYNNLFAYGTNNRATLDAVIPRFDGKDTQGINTINIEKLSNSDVKIEFSLPPEAIQNIIEKQISKGYNLVARLELLIEPSECDKINGRNVLVNNGYALSGDIVGMMITIDNVETEALPFVWYSDELI